MTTGPEFVLDHLALYSLLRDPAFYRDIPLFLFMKPQAEAVLKRINASFFTAQGNIRSMLDPLMLTFVRIILEAQATAPRALEPLIALIGQRKGLKPAVILVYYRNSLSDEPQVITL